MGAVTSPLSLLGFVIHGCIFCGVGFGRGAGANGSLFYFAGIERGREESGNRTESLRLSDRQTQIMRANICRAPGISAFVEQDAGGINMCAGRCKSFIPGLRKPPPPFHIPLAARDGPRMRNLAT